MSQPQITVKKQQGMKLLFVRMCTLLISLQNSNSNIQTIRTIFNNWLGGLAKSSKTQKNTSKSVLAVELSPGSPCIRFSTTRACCPHLKATPLIRFHQARARDTRPAANRSKVFSDDQWRVGGKDGERCHTSTSNKCRRIEKSPCRIGEAVQAPGGGDGEVEG